jgi:sulfonate transport system substrate-binding protein
LGGGACSSPAEKVVIRLLARGFGVAGLLFLLEACKGAPSTDRIPKAATDKLQPVVIRFSDPGNGGTVFPYAKREKIYERELAKVNATIQWVPGAQAFSANFDAMNAGAINASGGAISPIVGALSHNLKFKIFAISDAAAIRQAGIVVPHDSPVRSVKDLVGKRVAVNQAAHGDYILLKALVNAGVPIEAVNRVNIQPPDAAAAFATGKLDAWSTFGVFFNTAVRNGAHVLLTEADIVSDDVNVTAANAEILEKNPEVFKEFIKITQDLVEQAHKFPERFQNVFTDKGPTALSGEDLRLSLEYTRTLPSPRIPTQADRVRVANVVELFVSSKSIDRALSVDEVIFDVDEATRKKGSVL